MSGPNSPPPESPHLVSLVLHSKKALQHGEQLCTRANDLSRASSRTAVEMLALDAKVRWIAQGIQDQLELAVSVAKSIEVQRGNLTERVKQWDKSRAMHSSYLDEVLESLGSQAVPPDFHQTSSSSSLFASPSSDEEDEGTTGKSKTDRSKWKTLRDFVDERGIEDAVEGMDSDRMALDDILCITEEHPKTILSHVQVLRDSLPTTSELPSIEETFNSQENTSTALASHLESLAAHYDQMASALRDKEAGVEFSEDDLQDMNRDTEELPAIIAELEDDVRSIESSYNRLLSARQTAQQCVDQQCELLDHLDELGDLMSDMLERQQNVETECEIHLATLQSHTSTLENLYITYTSYRSSYNSLLLEMNRRHRYRENAENIMREMSAQLADIREREIQARESFYSMHGPHLPDDLCLSISNLPTKWEVTPAHGENIEALPAIEEDLLIEARKHAEVEQGGSASL